MLSKPNVCRVVMFITAMAGVIIAGIAGEFWGFQQFNLLFCIGIVIAIAGLLFGFLTVRCPHCGHLLDLRLTGTADFCPFCGKKFKE